MRDPSLRELSYYVMPTKDPVPAFVAVHDKAFDFWMRSLGEAYRETGNDPKSLHDEFIRQDLVTCILHGEQVIAVLLLSFYSLEAKAARTYRYLADNFSDLYFQRLKEDGMRNVLAMQYLAVHPDWRKSRREVHIASTITALAQRVRDEHGLDASICVVRRDIKVNELVYSLGGECIEANVENHHTRCDLTVIRADRPPRYPNVAVEKLTDSLWRDRILVPHPVAKKKAA